jgi:hypothetical protein
MADNEINWVDELKRHGWYERGFARWQHESFARDHNYTTFSLEEAIAEVKEKGKDGVYNDFKTRQQLIEENAQLRIALLKIEEVLNGQNQS